MTTKLQTIKSEMEEAVVRSIDCCHCGMAFETYEPLKPNATKDLMKYFELVESDEYGMIGLVCVNCIEEEPHAFKIIKGV